MKWRGTEEDTPYFAMASICAHLCAYTSPPPPNCKKNTNTIDWGDGSEGKGACKT